MGTGTIKKVKEDHSLSLNSELSSYNKKFGEIETFQP